MGRAIRILGGITASTRRWSATPEVDRKDLAAGLRGRWSTDTTEVGVVIFVRRTARIWLPLTGGTTALARIVGIATRTQTGQAGSYALIHTGIVIRPRRAAGRWLGRRLAILTGGANVDRAAAVLSSRAKHPGIAIDQTARQAAAADGGLDRIAADIQGANAFA